MKFVGIGKKSILITFSEWTLTGFRVKISHCMALVLIDDMSLLETSNLSPAKSGDLWSSKKSEILISACCYEILLVI